MNLGFSFFSHLIRAFLHAIHSYGKGIIHRPVSVAIVNANFNEINPVIKITAERQFCSGKLILAKEINYPFLPLLKNVSLDLVP